MTEKSYKDTGPLLIDQCSLWACRAGCPQPLLSASPAGTPPQDALQECTCRNVAKMQPTEPGASVSWLSPTRACMTNWLPCRSDPASSGQRSGCGPAPDCPSRWEAATPAE